MAGYPHFDRVRQLFADQFEPEGPGFLYRKSMKSAPVRVSGEERDRFVETFNRRLRYATWSLVPATLAMIALCMVLAPDPDSKAGQFAIYIGMGCILVPFAAAYHWAWGTPARELRRRPVAGNIRTNAEVRRVVLGRMSYGYIALVALFAILGILRLSSEVDVLHGWGRLWLVLGALLIVTTGVQLFRKWRLERE